MNPVLSPLPTLLALACLALACLALSAKAQPLFTPPSVLNSLNGSASGNSVHVLVGGSGTILVSSNAVNWVDVSTVTNNLAGVAFGLGRFIAISPDGLTLVSTTGRDWTVQSHLDLPKGAEARGIAFANTGGGLFAAVDSSGRILSTTTGSTWNTLYQSTTDEEFVGIASNGNTFAAAGVYMDDSFNDRSVIRISNGVSPWNRERNVLNEYLEGIFWVQDKFMAVGWLDGDDIRSRLVTSQAGTTWSLGSVDSSAILHGAAYGAGYFWLLGDEGTVLYSTSGTRNWKAAGFPDDDYSTLNGGFTDASGNPVLFGDRLLVIPTATSQWVDLLELETPEFNQLACGNGKCVGVSGEYAWVANEPAHWIPTRIPFRELGLTDWNLPEFASIAFGNGVFVAVGDITDPEGKIHSVVVTSSDGLKWVINRIQPGESMKTILFANNTFVAGGSRISGTVQTPQTWRSSNGSFWPNPSPLPAATTNRTEILTLTASPEAFVATGNGGALYRSTDGTLWTDHSLDTEDSLKAATFATARFSVVSDLGEVWRSTDGTSWELEPELLDEGFTGIIQGANRIVGLGGGGHVWVSSNGSNWEQIQTPTGAELYCGVFDGKQYIVAGSSGTLLTSPDGLAWTRVYGDPLPAPQEPPQLRLKSQEGLLFLEVVAKPDSSVTLESSPSLGGTAVWSTLTILKLGQTNALVPMPITPDSARFVRAKTH